MKLLPGAGKLNRLHGTIQTFAFILSSLVMSTQWSSSGWAEETGTSPLSTTGLESPLRQAPRVLSPKPLGVGRSIPDLAFTDIRGKQGTLSKLPGDQATVLAMTGTGCPLCKKYSPTLVDLERRYKDRGVSFVFLNPNESESIERLQTELKNKGFTGPYVRDDEEAITRSLDVKTTTEVFVLDKNRTLVYRGAVDDQYGFGYSLDAPRETYLADALDAVLDDRQPVIQATSSPGCEMFYQTDRPEPRATEVTYHNRISRILQRHCVECHQDGGVTPMSLTNYEEVRDYAGMIRSVIDRGVMPPWFAAPNETSSQAETTIEGSLSSRERHALLWANERMLDDSERVDLMSWVEADAPEGDPADAPEPRSFVDGWMIGKPDAVFEFPQAIPIKATGVLSYKTVTIETDLDQDRWIQAIEIVPGDRRVVHHALAFVLPPNANRSERREAIDYWGIYVPGNSTQVYPLGYARYLPKGSTLKFQMHYTTMGEATEDKTKIGLIFADSPPKYEVKTANITNPYLRIPAGAERHKVDASIRVPSDIQLIGYLPHHHLRGTACRYELTTVDGDSEVLLDIPRYDFNWQLFYRYTEPKLIPKGSRLTFTGWYDNSTNNPSNPDATKSVRWGQQTFDEMHVGYIEYIVPNNRTASDSTNANRDAPAKPPRATFLDLLDVNGDGELTKDEVRERMPSRTESVLRFFDMLDRNRDGKLDKEEAARLQRGR
ncbi:MAG: redoxin family protein [Planctomycetaceae bacterium]|nr:redoxin family protein [Planctomycetaceae bacterium]